MTARKPRIALRESIIAHARAVQQVEQAEDVLEKARALSDSLVTQADEYASLDADMATAQAASLKLALASGETHLPDDDHSEFASKQIARDNVQTHLARVQSSLPILEQELEEAERHVTECDLSRERACEKVFCAEAEAMASTYLARLTELRRVAYILAQMHHKQVRRAPSDPGTPTIGGQIWGTGPFRKVATSAVVDEAVQENIIGFFEQKHGFGLRHESGKQVAEFWNALKEDANAVLGDEPAQEQEAAE